MKKAGRNASLARYGMAWQYKASGIEPLRLVKGELAGKDGERDVVRSNVDQGRAASAGFAANQFDQLRKQAHPTVVFVCQKVAEFVGQDYLSRQPDALGGGCHDAYHRVSSGSDAHDRIAQRISKIFPAVKILSSSVGKSFPQ